MKIKALLFGFLLSVTTIASAGYTVTWTPPTHNTDESLLTDLAGYNLWCLYAFNADGTPRVYGAPAVLGKDEVTFVKDWAGPGDWKCKMQAFNEAGVTSVDSKEVFFTLVDADGDGNGHIDKGGPVVVVFPNAPDIVLECPDVVQGTCDRNTLTVTRKGYFLITGPDGQPLLNDAGTVRQTTSKDKAYEYITQDGRDGLFIIEPPKYEVLWQ